MVPRDEWSWSGFWGPERSVVSGAVLFTYEEELYVIGGNRDIVWR